ncbi:MAG: hypothetical protein GY863_22905, partial [bacterium]|nr:hypothetical protein [bacterium]
PLSDESLPADDTNLEEVSLEESGDADIEMPEMEELLSVEDEGAPLSDEALPVENAILEEDGLNEEETVLEESSIEETGEAEEIDMPDVDALLAVEDEGASLAGDAIQEEVSLEEPGEVEEMSADLIMEDETQESDIAEMSEEPIEMDTALEMSEIEESGDMEELTAETEQAVQISDEFEPVEEDIVSSETEEGELSSIEDFGIEREEEVSQVVPEGIEMEQTEKIALDEVKSDEIFSQDSSSMEDVDDTDITIDLDSLDIQLEEDDVEEGTAESIDDGPVESLDIQEEALEPMQEEQALEEDDDSDVTLDLDSLDLVLDEGEEIQEEDDDSDVTLDLDSLDLVLDEGEEMQGEEVQEEDDDSDVTLDLDSLDLVLDEGEEMQEGEMLDDDERISLADAGLTPEQLVDEKAVQEKGEEAEEEIRFSIDEVAPEVSMETIDETEESAGPAMTQEREFEDLPEIDIVKFEESDVDLDLTLEPKPISQRGEYSGDEAEMDEIERESLDTVPGGVVNFSIDYSLKFSSIGALLRLSGLFLIGLMPHLIVSIIYSVLSIILGILNSAVISLTGESVEDFMEIQENTLRRLLSFGACLTDVVEDMPLFSGRKDIDYSLQFDVTYPVRRSRILALLRLSIAGILIVSLPHLIILLILTIGSIPICIAGIVSVVFKKIWPNILFDSMIKYFRYAAAIFSYIIGLVDNYPKFKFE